MSIEILKGRVEENRTRAREALNDIGWPVRKDEIWRRTPVELIDPESFRPVPPWEETPSRAQFPEGQGESGGDIIFNGKDLTMQNIDPGMPGIPEIITDESLITIREEEIESFYPGDWADRFSAWNESSPTLFLFLSFRANQTLEKRLHIHLNALSRDSLFMPKIFFRFETGWQGHLILHINGRKDGKDRELVNSLIRCYIGPNAHVKMTQVQNLGTESRYVEEAFYAQETHSSLDFSLLHLGGTTVKTNSLYSLQGSGADLHVHGFSVAGKGQHKDIRIEQRHHAPHTSSRAEFDGYAEDRGRAIFQGMIRVEHDAPGTDAYLSNKNLILSNGARADAIPGLKILTDDVKCSHGSTTGKLDPAQLFYLQSRGLSREESRKMLIEGKMGENLKGNPPELTEWIMREGLKHLNRG